MRRENISFYSYHLEMNFRQDYCFISITAISQIFVRLYTTSMRIFRCEMAFISNYQSAIRNGETETFITLSLRTTNCVILSKRHVFQNNSKIVSPTPLSMKYSLIFKFHEYSHNRNFSDLNKTRWARDSDSEIYQAPFLLLPKLSQL